MLVMNRIKIILSFIIFFSAAPKILAQSVIPEFNENTKELEIPFERYGNYIIIKIEFKDGMRCVFCSTRVPNTLFWQKKKLPLSSM